MDEPKGTGQPSTWWSRPRRAAEGRTATGAEPPAASEAAGAADAPCEPLHGVDPYATPPYGEPGPWAPAPPVQRPAVTPPRGVALPGATPAHGTRLPSATPPHGVPAPSVTPPRGIPAPALPPQQGAGGSPVSPSDSAPAPSHKDSHKDAAPPHGTLPHGVPVPAATPPHGVRVPGQGTAAGGAGEWPGGRGYAFQQPVPGPAARPPRTPSRLSRLAVGACALALVAGVAGGLIGAYVERHGQVTDIELPQAGADPAADGGPRPKGSIAGIARRALPGVVTLHARGGGSEATGTGFVLDRRGHILTNNHVVESAKGADAVRVTFSSGQTATGRVVGSDSGYDLAVVEVSGVSGLRPLPLGDSDAVRVGDPVVAIGAPYDLDGTVTTGIISAKERPITAGGEEPGSEMSYVDALQTDAPINPGNSGGPLMDGRGRVIGVNSAIKAAGSGSALPDGKSGGSIGLGFAIPVNQARRVAEELINDGQATHPVIGVTLDMEYRGEGARIGGSGGGGEAVAKGGPADEAGLAEGDVITRVNGKAVADGEELIVRVRSHRPGDRLELVVRRGGAGGAERSVSLTLGSASG
ncbi:trypsin-like peptidase domain-containing protein [Streptomyces sp. enrichment culture]|uniref:S1C family serine protease n=1 Tax=Streptomyces sp. enrichment culture TaxID=1795815 RepID=UPI003F5465A0